VVVADHEPGAGHEPLAELLVPVQHRAGRAGDEQDRRIVTVTEALNAKVDAVRSDDLLG
jgi:hypothetical protein